MCSRDFARSSVLALFGLAFQAGIASADAVSLVSMAGPLSANPAPKSLDLGFFGTVQLGGAMGGLFFEQDNAASNRQTYVDVGNAQLFVQKSDGPVQFFMAAGIYALPALGSSYVTASRTPRLTYGFMPEAFLKVAANDQLSFQIGKLPTLIGAEYTFTFENINVERGLLWNQEPAISRGVQATYSTGPLNFSLSWNDGFYSDRFDWVAASAAYSLGTTDTVSLVGAGNLGHDDSTTAATPLLQNNGEIYDLMYTHSGGPWTLAPYLQWTRAVSPPPRTEAASSWGAAILASYSLNDTWRAAGRVEYIGTEGLANILYGPASRAWSIAITPTFQNGIVFARGELSYVSAGHLTPGAGFGANGSARSQTRVLAEAGWLF